MSNQKDPQNPVSQTNLENQLEQLFQKTTVKLPENAILTLINSLRQMYPEDAERRIALINNFVQALPTNDETFQAYYQAMTIPEDNPAIIKEINHPQITATMLGKFVHNQPQTFWELWAAQPLDDRKADYEGQVFCETVLALNHHPYIQKMLEDDLILLAEGQPIKNWNNLYNSYINYWFNSERHVAISQILAFLETCPNALIEAEANLAITTDPIEKQSLENKIGTYRNFVFFLSAFAEPSDLEILACLQSFLQDFLIPAEDKNVFYTVLSNIQAKATNS